ncbi:MAG: epoxyqueuosine reductase QueH [Bacteroidales bacterium]|jgi:predicted adenine nucleotide alpha hydrolase (AANH) superfamily ATPase
MNDNIFLIIMKTNYQKILDETIAKITESKHKPTLLLHSCCAPCSTYVLDYLSKYFKIIVYYYNPNIYPTEEYFKRVEEQKWFVNIFNKEFNPETKVEFLEGKYNKEDFYKISQGLENEPEGGLRCIKCYELRLNEAAVKAKEIKADYFTTTLSISPMKNADALNKIGVKIGEKYNVNYLLSDFKKKEGFKKSVQISNKYNMYRQEYCGCEFSKIKL